MKEIVTYKDLLSIIQEPEDVPIFVVYNKEQNYETRIKKVIEDITTQSSHVLSIDDSGIVEIDGLGYDFITDIIEVISRTKSNSYLDYNFAFERNFVEKFVNILTGLQDKELRLATFIFLSYVRKARVTDSGRIRNFASIYFYIKNRNTDDFLTLFQEYEDFATDSILVKNGQLIPNFEEVVNKVKTVILQELKGYEDIDYWHVKHPTASMTGMFHTSPVIVSYNFKYEKITSAILFLLDSLFPSKENFDRMIYFQPYVNVFMPKLFTYNQDEINDENSRAFYNPFIKEFVFCALVEQPFIYEAYYKISQSDYMSYKESPAFFKSRFFKQDLSKCFMGSQNTGDYATYIDVLTLPCNYPVASSFLGYTYIAGLLFLRVYYKDDIYLIPPKAAPFASNTKRLEFVDNLFYGIKENEIIDMNEYCNRKTINNDYSKVIFYIPWKKECMSIDIDTSRKEDLLKPCPDKSSMFGEFDIFMNNSYGFFTRKDFDTFYDEQKTTFEHNIAAVGACKILSSRMCNILKKIDFDKEIDQNGIKLSANDVSIQIKYNTDSKDLYSAVTNTDTIVLRVSKKQVRQSALDEPSVFRLSFKETDDIDAFLQKAAEKFMEFYKYG